MRQRRHLINSDRSYVLIGTYRQNIYSNIILLPGGSTENVSAVQRYFSCSPGFDTFTIHERFKKNLISGL